MCGGQCTPRDSLAPCAAQQALHAPCTAPPLAPCAALQALQALALQEQLEQQGYLQGDGQMEQQGYLQGGGQWQEDCCEQQYCGQGYCDPAATADYGYGWCGEGVGQEGCGLGCGAGGCGDFAEGCEDLPTAMYQQCAVEASWGGCCGASTATTSYMSMSCQTSEVLAETEAGSSGGSSRQLSGPPSTSAQEEQQLQLDALPQQQQQQQQQQPQQRSVVGASQPHAYSSASGGHRQKPAYAAARGGWSKPSEAAAPRETYDSAFPPLSPNCVASPNPFKRVPRVSTRKLRAEAPTFQPKPKQATSPSTPKAAAAAATAAATAAVSPCHQQRALTLEEEHLALKLRAEAPTFTPSPPSTARSSCSSSSDACVIMDGEAARIRFGSRFGSMEEEEEGAGVSEQPGRGELLQVHGGGEGEGVLASQPGEGGAGGATQAGTLRGGLLSEGSLHSHPVTYEEDEEEEEAYLGAGDL